MTALYPMLMEPKFDERIWGGDGLAAMLGKPAPRDRRVGESWEVYDENPVQNGDYAGKTIAELRQIMGAELMGHCSADRPFPLLTKLIDAHDVLSVQVHPDDRFAQRLEDEPNGKTECWYVIHAEPGAVLTYGFSENASPAEYERLVAEGKLETILRELPVHAGDVVYIPAGTVHAIGAGIILYELQQTSDVTYRIYDWNRRDSSGHPRELHVDKARQVLNYHQETAGTVKPLSQPYSGRSMLVAGPYFSMELVETGATMELPTYASPVAMCSLEHAVSVSVGETIVDLPAYSSVLIPAAAGSFGLGPGADGTSPARALIAYVPESAQVTRNVLLSRGFSDEEIDAFLAQFAPIEELGEAVR